MYSQQGGRPGAGPPKMANRYMKGRLPEGVDFAQYPGRSSTPLPTAESKSAERINQLKIWNEAATSDEKRRLNAAKGMSSVPHPAGRRTDSFKDAKDRHSASFHGTPSSQAPTEPDPEEEQEQEQEQEHVVADAIAHPPSYHRTAVGSVGAPKQRHQDMFADRSDSESEEDPEETTETPIPGESVHADISDRIAAQPLRSREDYHQTAHHHVPPPRPHMAPAAPPPMTHQHVRPTNPISSRGPHSAPHNSRQEPKRSKACCTIM